METKYTTQVRAPVLSSSSHNVSNCALCIKLHSCLFIVGFYHFCFFLEALYITFTLKLLLCAVTRWRHNMYFQDDDDYEFESVLGTTVFPRFFPEHATVTLGILSPLSRVKWCVSFHCFSSVSLQRKSPQGKLAKTSPAAPRLQRSLLNRLQTHKQVRAEEGSMCLLCLRPSLNSNINEDGAAGLKLG